MRKPWSMSTTVRNPERLRDFLRVLQQLEGEPFNNDNQIKYQILLIQNKLYKPTKLTEEQESYFENPDSEMPYEIAETIFNSQGYKGPDMRGRQSANPLNKMGFAVAKETSGAVRITDFGRYFLSKNYDMGKVFFVNFLKWQLPNPDSRGFSEEDGFNIKPFIATLHLINGVNKRWIESGNEPVGINKEEFALFAVTLVDYREVGKHVGLLIDFRNKLRAQESESAKRDFREKYYNSFASKFLNTKEASDIKSFINNIFDYADNTIRYFRLTGYLFIRGGGYYIDLEPRRSIEINKLLESDNASPIEMSLDAYLAYISDINQPQLPWETEAQLKDIALKIREEIENYKQKLAIYNVQAREMNYPNLSTLPVEDLKTHIEDLRIYRRELQSEEIHLESQGVDIIDKYIRDLRNIFNSREKKSIELEYLATLSLNALNDALEIKPNYPVGDDNKPTFTAPGDRPDIECFYDSFNSICEVTMLTDRAQWYNEGQPVMRHLRDFEHKNTEKEAYCLFIAPRLHRDTINTFWNAIKYEYEGSKQRIIPLTIGQFTTLLETLIELKRINKRLSHAMLRELFDDMLTGVDRVSNSEEWLNYIPTSIESWKSTQLSS